MHELRHQILDMFQHRFGAFYYPLTTLFDSHRLRQIAGLVDVGAFEHRGVVGEELDRDGVEDRRDEGVDAGGRLR